MIQWNDGLNLGVKALDDDHKKILLITNNLSEAISNGEKKDVIENIFKELEDCTRDHFSREEAYLKDCGCIKLEEHIKKHRAFYAEFSKLKAKAFSSQNYTAVQDITMYLAEWLLNHIIEDDIPAVTTFKKCGLTKKEKEDQSLLAKLIKKITDRFSFTKRIFLSAIIPLSGMLLFGTIIIFGNFNKYLDMKKTSTITHITSNINKFIHNLQIERGLSSGYLTSKENKFKDNLNKQRIIVDEASFYFTNKIKNILSIEPHIKTLKRDIQSLNNLREQINNKTISKNQVINIYTKMINNLLNITPKIASLSLDRELSSSIATLSSIQHVKESLGQERAYGTIIIEKEVATLEEYISFTQLLSTRVAFLNTFEHTASKIQKSTNHSLINSHIAKQINIYEDMVLKHNFDYIDSEAWFKSTTEYINKIKLFEDELLSEINILIDSRIYDTIINFILWIIFNTTVLTITLFILYTFKRSTVIQIDQLTNAMKDLASGGRGFRLSPISVNRDELAYMYDAYETTRQKLLKGDIYTQLYLTQKDIELRNTQKENVELGEIAFIDPLTGALNRRKFEELSTLELKRAIRYKCNLSFLMLDIDHFKTVNDMYGHAVGDEVLKHFSSICLSMARDLDIVARVGGEEFIVMLPATDCDGAYKLAERFRKKVFNTSVNTENQVIKYSVSIGISILDISHDKDIQTILQRADKALYKAKDSGRNTTVIYSKDNT